SPDRRLDHPRPAGALSDGTPWRVELVGTQAAAATARPDRPTRAHIDTEARAHPLTRMTSKIDQPYATGLTRANIERALAEAGKRTDALQASDLAMLEDFHSLGRLATAALIDLAHISASDRVLDA